MSTTEGDPIDPAVWQRAADVLAIAVREGGPQALSRPALVRNLCADLLPDDPLVAQLILGAAEFDAVGHIRQNVAQGVDLNGAISLAAVSLGRHTYAPEAHRRWVVEQMAGAAGLGAAEATEAGDARGPMPPGPEGPTSTGDLPTIGVSQQPFGAPPLYPPPTGPGYPPPVGPAAPVPGGTSRRRPRRKIIILVGAALALVAIIVVVLVLTLGGSSGGGNNGNTGNTGNTGTRGTRGTPATPGRNGALRSGFDIAVRESAP